MAENDWDVTKPIDHTKIGDVPQKIRDVKSSAKIIIAKEHVTPSTDNAGGQHLKGSARVYLQSGLPTTDPEANNLDTSATSDDGRIAVNTAASNELRVFVATAAGVSTSWQHVRVGRVKADEDINANSHNIVNLASGTLAGQAIHVGQIDTTPLTGQLALSEPATDAKIQVAILDPPTEDSHIASKKYVDAHGIVQIVNTQTATKATLSGAIPLDDTIPQNTEGQEVMTLAITPTSATNKLLIEAVVLLGTSNGAQGIAALFKDSDADALAVSVADTDATDLATMTVIVRYFMDAGTTDEITFKVRAGSPSGTCTFNGLFSTAGVSSITITEIKG